METLCIIYSMNNINLTKKCAIIIPTMNKSSFIEDKLYYFNQINYKGTVHIADSSDNYHFDKSAYFINYFSIERTQPIQINNLCISTIKTKTPYYKYIKMKI